METRTAITVTDDGKRGEEKLKTANVDLNGYGIKTSGERSVSETASEEKTML